MANIKIIENRIRFINTESTELLSYNGIPKENWFHYIANRLIEEFQDSENVSEERDALKKIYAEMISTDLKPMIMDLTYGDWEVVTIQVDFVDIELIVKPKDGLLKELYLDFAEFSIGIRTPVILRKDKEFLFFDAGYDSNTPHHVRILRDTYMPPGSIFTNRHDYLGDHSDVFEVRNDIPHLVTSSHAEIDFNQATIEK